MIAFIKGRVLAKSQDYLILEAGSLGYKVFCSQEIVSKVILDTDLSLFLTHVVKEDKSDLYGFETQDEMEFFELLLSVSGVGPKSAMAILNLDSLDNIKSAIASGDEGYLSQVSGIGNKTAKKLLLELQDKLPKMEAAQHGNYEELMGALESLGYKKSEIKPVLKELNSNEDLQSQIKEALRLLSKN